MASCPSALPKRSILFSDNAPKATGTPTGFKMNVREVPFRQCRVRGRHLRQHYDDARPAKHPAAMDIDVDAEGRITGLF